MKIKIDVRRHHEYNDDGAVLTDDKFYDVKVIPGINPLQFKDPQIKGYTIEDDNGKEIIIWESNVLEEID